MNNTWLASPPGGSLNASLWPGTDRGRSFNETDVAEGLFFGYRWFDAHAALPPFFPFGHGLSTRRSPTRAWRSGRHPRRRLPSPRLCS